MTESNLAPQIPLEQTEALPEIQPIATIKGEPVLDLPKDLYIPPDAMKVLLDAFEGPLDFLLYLIRKQNIDILDIPIAAVTRQYMNYIDLMQNLTLELAAEYLVMAAILAEIKSRMLLPVIVDQAGEEIDPRADLVRRLQEYERYKQAAEALDKLPREERDVFVATADDSAIVVTKPLPQVSLRDLMLAFADILKRSELNSRHQIQISALSVREKMTHILSRIEAESDDHLPFTSLFDLAEGRLGVVVTFLALLELLKQMMVDFIQAAPFAPIYLKPTRS